MCNRGPHEALAPLLSKLGPSLLMPGVTMRGPGFSVRYESESAAVVRGPGFSVRYESESAAVAIAR